MMSASSGWVLEDSRLLDGLQLFGVGSLWRGQVGGVDYRCRLGGFDDSERFRRLRRLVSHEDIDMIVRTKPESRSPSWVPGPVGFGAGCEGEAVAEQEFFIMTLLRRSRSIPANQLHR